MGSLRRFEDPSRPKKRQTWPAVASTVLAVVLLLTLLSSTTLKPIVCWTFGFPRQPQAHKPYHGNSLEAHHGVAERLSQMVIGAPQNRDSVTEDILKGMTGHLGTPVVNALEELHYALETMQTSYFKLWLGSWPDTIDWTAAVMGTYMSASLYSLTRSLEYILPWRDSSGNNQMQVEGQKVENEINKYFSQSVAYYFGEDDFSIRLQAYDDMLWVVLGWLENIRFIQLHTQSHYPVFEPSAAADGESPQASWYGQQFTPAFAHRARVFYDLAEQGWDTRLCGGGMNWNPYLLPYKNAITNELFISASIGMYLYFPGDDNDSPFLDSKSHGHDASPTARPKPAIPHDPAYLDSAVKAYDWLKHSNMTNDLGLYVDGFHIRHYGVNGTIGTGKCDVRNEMVYTYNQGVLLSGLRGLWEATGKISYLEDGHALVRALINATGWDIATSLPKERGSRKWEGLGRGGILEDYCDASGRCTQNGQTFKGIYFHHLTLFCEPLPTSPLIPGLTYTADPETAALHAQSCREYAAWVAHNAVAAMTTRDERGRFGMWWAADSGAAVGSAPLPPRAVDYRNWERYWGTPWKEAAMEPSASSVLGSGEWADGEFQWPADVVRKSRNVQGDDVATQDLNDRGRGRTVETQGGGVAVVRAMWEFVHMYQGKKGS